MKNKPGRIVIAVSLLLAGSLACSLPGFAEGGEPSAAARKAYQQYLSAYNKLNQLMAGGRGDTLEAQAAYSVYQEAKDRWEAVSQAEGITEDGFSSAEPAEEAGEPAGEELPSLQEAYDRYIAAYNQLTKLAVEARISGPPELKKLSDEYHENLEKYNATQDRNAYQAYIAAHNRLVSWATRTEFTGPENLRQAREDYFQAKTTYDNLVKQSQ